MEGGKPIAECFSIALAIIFTSLDIEEKVKLMGSIKRSRKILSIMVDLL